MIDSKLLNDILTFEIDDPSSTFKFSDRLVAENLYWTKEFALRCIDEYKKFIVMCVRINATPSIQVDEVWHLHMNYTRSYHEMCEVIGRFIHHGPTKGGDAEDAKYLEQYQNTLELYRTLFGEPPIDIWPSPEDRFSPQRFIRVDLNKHYIVPVNDNKALFKILKRNILW